MPFAAATGQLSGAPASMVGMGTGRTFDREPVMAALVDFLTRTDQLTARAWKRLMPPDMPPSRVPVTLGKPGFSQAIVDYALEHADPDRTYTWTICPTGARHNTDTFFRGTVSEYRDGHCPQCDAIDGRRGAWQASIPPFKDRHPDLVDFLLDPADAESTGMVRFACADCGDHTPFSPTRSQYGPVPRCGWCRTAGGAHPGDVVPRRGGGAHVQLEDDLAAALTKTGIPSVTGHGVLTVKGSYVTPVICPDLILLSRRIAIEIDHADDPRGPGRHDQPDGIADDQLRDQLLSDLRWRVLRIRRPDQAVKGPWPWRIETTSISPSTLATLIGSAVDLR